MGVDGVGLLTVYGTMSESLLLGLLILVLILVLEIFLLFLLACMRVLYVFICFYMNYRIKYFLQQKFEHL